MNLKEGGKKKRYRRDKRKDGDRRGIKVSGFLGIKNRGFCAEYHNRNRRNMAG